MVYQLASAIVHHAQNGGSGAGKLTARYTGNQDKWPSSRLLHPRMRMTHRELEAVTECFDLSSGPTEITFLSGEDKLKSYSFGMPTLSSSFCGDCGIFICLSIPYELM